MLRNNNNANPQIIIQKTTLRFCHVGLSGNTSESTTNKINSKATHASRVGMLFSTIAQKACAKALLLFMF